MGHALRVFALTYICLTYIDHSLFHRVASFLYVYSMGVPCCCMIGTVSVPYLCCIFAVALLCYCRIFVCYCRVFAVYVPLPSHCRAFAVSLPCLCRVVALPLPWQCREVAARSPRPCRTSAIASPPSSHCFSVAILVVVRFIALPRVVDCFLLMCRVVSMPLP